MSLNNNNKKGKNVKVIEIHADNVEDAMEQVKDKLMAAAAGMDHAGHGCENDPERGTLAGTKKIVKTWKATKEEIAKDAEIEKLRVEYNALIDKADAKKREYELTKDKFWSGIRLRLDNFNANLLRFDTKSGEIHLIEKAFKNDK
jgi:hypothetical protein